MFFQDAAIHDDDDSGISRLLGGSLVNYAFLKP
jgi:hypothetical protein